MTHNKVMLVTSHLPTSLNAGNLAYLKVMIDLLGETSEKLLIVVIGDRFVDHEFAVRDPSAKNIRYVTSYTRVIAGYHVLRGIAYWARNVLRRIWRKLPNGIRQSVARTYFADPSGTAVTTGNTAADLLANKPVQKNAVELLARCIDRFSPTHLIIDKLDLFHYVQGIPLEAVKTGVLCHDLVSKRHSDAASLGLSVDMAPISQDEEFKRLAAMDFVIAIQKAEATEIAGRVAGRVAYIPYLPTSARPQCNRVSQGTRDNRLLFVGSGGTPNTTGLAWFLETVWPKILANQIDVEMDVVGAVCDFVEQRAAQVTFHGKVPDVLPFYRSTDVVVVPLRVGSGLKIKLVEALASGSACVTTDVGAQGLEEAAPEALLIANDPETFAKQVLRLLGDRSLRDSVSACALQFVARSFDRTEALAALKWALEAPVMLRNDSFRTVRPAPDVEG